MPRQATTNDLSARASAGRVPRVLLDTDSEVVSGALEGNDGA